MSPVRKLNLTGQRFGNWTALRPAEKPAYWTCRCICGAVVDVFIGSLRGGKSKGCTACMNRWMKESGRARKNATKHGMFRSSEYRSWHMMKERCYRPKHEQFSNYGGRGITVCDRWRDSFEAFLEDMGLKPTPKHTIDRINANGNYTRANCRWATVREQNRNKRNSRWIEFDGKRLRLIDAAHLYGVVSYGTVKARIDRGWNALEALTTSTLR